MLFPIEKLIFFNTKNKIIFIKIKINKQTPQTKTIPVLVTVSEKIFFLNFLTAFLIYLFNKINTKK